MLRLLLIQRGKDVKNNPVGLSFTASEHDEICVDVRCCYDGSVNCRTVLVEKQDKEEPTIRTAAMRLRWSLAFRWCENLRVRMM